MSDDILTVDCSICSDYTWTGTYKQAKEENITLCKKCRDDLTIKELNEMVKKKYGKCKK